MVTFVVASRRREHRHLAHARDDTLRALVETRGGIAERKVEASHLERIRRLAELRVRGILLDG